MCICVFVFERVYVLFVKVSTQQNAVGPEFPVRSPSQSVWMRLAVAASLLSAALSAASALNAFGPARDSRT